MKRGIVDSMYSILLFYSSHIERMNSCREERLHLFQGLGHISSVKVLSKRSGKVEEFFPEGPEKVTRGGGRNIYTMEEEKILEKYFFLNSVEEDISVLFISS